LLENLQQTGDLFNPVKHILENPNSILEVDVKDIKAEKYLTPEEKAKIEEERKMEEDRLKALEGDNVGQRGLKVMMNGVCEMKKEKNIMQLELVREEWMNKSVADMSEEEKLKLKEFEAKEKELEEEKQK
jgi:cilia- and flagella-associated protein 43